jgi:thymidylate synthase ThyX
MPPKRADDLTDQEREILRPYVSDVDADVFVLKNLNPEVIGAALARYSRAPTGFKETVAREFLNEDGTPNITKGAQLVDRVINKFGDESVAELAVAPICIENISNLTAKIIEDCRIGGSPIEESTRYVLYDQKRDGRWRYVVPPDIEASNLNEKFRSTMDHIFETYADLVDPIQNHFRKKLPEDEFEIDVEHLGKTRKAKRSDLKTDGELKAFNLAYGFTIRSAACDVIRCILPACAKANLGLVGNGRFFTGLISKLLTQDLKECHVLAGKIRTALDTYIPTFVKRAERNEYLAQNDRAMRKLSKEIFQGIPVSNNPEVDLLEDKAEDFQTNLLTGMLFPLTRHPTRQIRQIVAKLPDTRKQEIFSTYIGKRQSKRDRPGRALENGYPIQFDIIAGFAEYRDLQRHRMLTQQRQDLGVDLGYSIPEEIIEIGKEDVVRECFQRAESLHGDLMRAGMEREAQYAALFNHFIRWNIGMNLREMGHLTELRSQKAGHPKYRRTVQLMAKLYLKRHPEMAPVLQFVDNNDYGGGVTRAEQEARTALKSLATGVFDDMD